MSRPRVYVDSCVLILAAASSDDEVGQRAIAELDRDAQFLFSAVVELETLPQASVNDRAEQVAFFRDFFDEAERVECDSTVQQLAIQQACIKPGLSAADALHVACAMTAKATELLTAEGSKKPLPKAKGIPVRSIQY